MADDKKIARTGENSHRATGRGYAMPDGTGAGQLIEEGDILPADVPVSDEWMVKIAASDRRRAAAVAQARDPSPRDADLTQLGLPGLGAMAAERGIDPKGLSEADMIAAIRAEREPVA
jgi:hypothetical protein